jgi:ABC-type bacteriocin/lantibiotic exporter with double-glycine peptidase domain
MVALVGASGAGKSTLLRLLAGQIAPSAGRLAYAGHAIDGDAARRWLGAQARCKPQDPSFLRGRVAEIIAPGLARPDEAALVAALRAAGLGAALDRGELGLNTEVGTNGAGLSGGQRQALALARAFHAEPGDAASNELLLLDEPTLGLDRTAQDQVLRSLESLREGRCIVIATHAAEVIHCADRVLVLDRGRLVADAPPARLLGARAQPESRAMEAAP